MAELNITVRGLDRLQRKFARFAAESPGEFDRTMGRWAKRTANHLKRRAYPATRPGQRYKRTRLLKRSWEAIRKKSLEWTIGNRAQRRGRAYASFVVGDNQAFMHKGRWWKASDEIEAKQPELVKMLTKDIRRLLF